jgi:hypothetical protein
MRALLVCVPALTSLLAVAPIHAADAPNSEREALVLATKIDQLIAKR